MPNKSAEVICEELPNIATEAILAELHRRGFAVHVRRQHAEKELPLTHETLTNCLRYDPETGKFFSRIRRDAEGRDLEVGSPNGRGYTKVYVQGSYYSVHRLAWFYVHKEWPPHDVDHINGDRLDNRLCNLRCVTRKQNAENRRTVIGKSGIRGVCWCIHKKAWKAAVQHNKKVINLGYFKTKELAGAAAKAGRDRLFTHHTT